MKNNLFAVSLAVALFCGLALADDGNMGGGNYTDCNGTNPPPTCDCNVPDPPTSCPTGGYANTQYSTEEQLGTDYFLAAEMTGESIMTFF